MQIHNLEIAARGGYSIFIFPMFLPSVLFLYLLSEALPLEGNFTFFVLMFFPSVLFLYLLSKVLPSEGNFFSSL